MEIGYFNGKYVSLNEAVLPIDERGHQFGDGIYEVVRVYDGKPFMLDEHLERLIRSGNAIKLRITETKEDLCNLIIKAIEESELKECVVYLQITRGIAVRGHLFPDVPMSISMTVREAKPLPAEVRLRGVTAILLEDERWANCYIKSLNLLPNILAKQAAHDAGSYEAILVRDGQVTEGSSSNVFYVKDRKVYTPPLTKHILPGITRLAVKNVLSQLNIPLVEQQFSEMDLLHADEVFITSTTSEVIPVIKINENEIGKGTPGEITSRIYEQYKNLIKAHK
ncbi:D-amino-acid transaminase [Bacillus massilinigeriensis]|uniref:D-amino-acid transaminase n=1 Tax=Bacillus massilionigeriensis TaxID=1805475 RepID=UPI00096ADEE2|nr:D-amino-acid transaminase [Bacillus massilionigeriensis]